MPGTRDDTAPTTADTSHAPDTYDLVVLGVGSGGEVVAQGAAEQGMRVAAVESGLLGGDCPFLACIPSKVLLVAAARARTQGTDLREAWAEAVRSRQEAVRAPGRLPPGAGAAPTPA